MTRPGGPAGNGTVAVRILRGTAPGGRLGLCMRNPSGSVRWSLARVWPATQGTKPRRMVWIMLNPSRADHEHDDATVRRCVGYALREGCNSVAVINLVPLVATYPAGMLAGLQPGPRWWQEQNTLAIRSALQRVDSPPLVIAGWGTLGTRPEIAGYRAQILALLDDAGITPHALGVTVSGEPVHPLRQRSDAPLIPWSPRA